MSVAFLFWLLFVLYLLFSYYRHRAGAHEALLIDVLVAALLFLIGCKVFGFPIQG